MKPTASLELITPEWAIATLEKAEDQIARGEYHQRSFSESVAQAYAIAMSNGHWLVNDQGIMFDTKGYLRDGRHRLWAVVMSGKSVEMWVMRNCSDKEIDGLTIRVVDTVDVGRTRTVSNQLAIDGIVQAPKMASGARCVARIATGFPPHFKITVIQSKQVLEIYSHHIVKLMDGFHNNGRYLVGYMLAPLAMFRNFSAGPADQFTADYFGMQNLPPGSPVIALSKYISNKSGSGTDLTDAATKAVALALYHYERGTSVNAIRHSDIGTNWLIEKQKSNVAKIRAIMGMNFHDHRTP